MILPIIADTAKIISKKLSENFNFDKSISKFLFDDNDDDTLI